MACMSSVISIFLRDDAYALLYFCGRSRVIHAYALCVVRMIFYRRKRIVICVAKEEIFTGHNYYAALLKHCIEFFCGNRKIVHEQPEKNGSLAFVNGIVSACKIFVNPLLCVF